MAITSSFSLYEWAHLAAAGIVLCAAFYLFFKRYVKGD